MTNFCIKRDEKDLEMLECIAKFRLRKRRERKQTCTTWNIYRCILMIKINKQINSKLIYYFFRNHNKCEKWVLSFLLFPARRLPRFPPHTRQAVRRWSHMDKLIIRLTFPLRFQRDIPVQGTQRYLLDVTVPLINLLISLSVVATYP